MKAKCGVCGDAVIVAKTPTGEDVVLDAWAAVYQLKDSVVEHVAELLDPALDECFVLHEEVCRGPKS